MTNVMSKAELLAKIQTGWDDFHIYLKTLTTEQLTIPTDAAGWTAKDHVIHLAVWEDSIIPMLEGKRRDEAMGIEKEMWKRHDFDEINAVIQQRHKALSLPEVMQAFDTAHQRVLEKIESMTDEDLGIPKLPDAIKTELVLKADTDPVSFQKYVDSKEVEIQWLVRRAIGDSKIDLGGATGNVTWSSGKGYIAKIPSTRKPLEYLTELAMTNSEEGRKFKEQLQTVMT